MQVLSFVVQLGAYPGGYLGAEQLDGCEHLGVRHAANVHLQEVAAVAEMLMQVDDALGDLLRVAGGPTSPTRSPTRPPGGRETRYQECRSSTWTMPNASS